MARVLILTLVFPPDGVSTAQIMGDLAQDLQGLGCEVTILTTTPHYNTDVEARQRQPLGPYWGRIVQRSTFHGCPVYHTAMPRKSESVVMRLMAWSLFHVISLVAGIGLIRRVDVIVSPSPPLTIGIVAWLLGLWHRAPFIYNVQEIYPDIAINLGVIRRRWLIRALCALERFVYARASRITVIADRMRYRLDQKGVPVAKIALIPNFAEPDLLKPVPRPNEFSRRFDLDGRFVVSYAGNLGPTQGLDTLLDAAVRLRDVPAIVIVLVGDGTLRESFGRRIAAERIDNVRLIPYQPFAVVPMIYGGSDICVVSQAVSTGADAVPSKVYRIMSCRRPVLAVTDPASDLAQLVREACCGVVVSQDSAGEVAAAIRGLFASQEALPAMGENGRRHVLAHYARVVVTRRYHQLIQELAAEAQAAR